MWFVLSLLLAIAIAAVLYILVIRPFLKGLPALKDFYAEADTFWQKAWALCWNSLTVLWSYVLLAGGFLVNQLDTIAAFLGDPDFKAQISAVFGADAKLVGGIFMGIAVINFASRMRSIIKGA